MPGLLNPVELDQSARMPGGLLTRALPVPAGWESGGVVVPFYGCGEPVLRDKCVTATDVPPRDTSAEFAAFPIEQGVTCSTSGNGDLNAHAQGRFSSTAEWALTRQLATDQAATGAPNFGDATLLGTVANGDFVTALGCLEQAAADAGFGAAWVIHSTVRGASYLAASVLMSLQGLSPTGAPIVVGSGYENPATTTVRLWATGRVWAGLSPIDVVDTIGHQRNDVDAWARGLGIVAFDPCLNLAIDVTVPACPA